MLLTPMAVFKTTALAHSVNLLSLLSIKSIRRFSADYKVFKVSVLAVEPGSAANDAGASWFQGRVSGGRMGERQSADHGEDEGTGAGSCEQAKQCNYEGRGTGKRPGES